MGRSKSEAVSRRKSETRRLTELIAVRFTPADKLELEQVAGQRGITVQQLLRESVLTSARAAS
ncbi:plasmid mobilization protein [Mycobacterium branderi]|uniref:Uncharacterized protein n=1 Tax=Mycobacterium branderi TaxID=43348 RepID=A0A7I7WGK4_9MYCO|nr:hypothetical protein [Mycobacterium branderi]MCV7236200.1 hypothetical protein [Mycobacterium branderi]ORA35388.1 hypothetical protein BST20_17440 [Mycobacterium branderi]BBZ15078.1 hypothetical protein MBRA_52730 [Mycobacterium branderi]